MKKTVFEVGGMLSMLDFLGVEKQVVFLGNRRLMESQGLTLGVLEAEAKRLQGSRRTVVHVARAGTVIGLIAIADAPRPRAKANWICEL